MPKVYVVVAESDSQYKGVDVEAVFASKDDADEFTDEAEKQLIEEGFIVEGRNDEDRNWEVSYSVQECELR